VNVLYDNDATPAKLSDKTIAIIGYGSQGRAHALNLRDSGHAVVVGLRPGSSTYNAVREDGLEAASIEDAASRGDVVMILAPDETQRTLYARSIQEHLKPGVYLAFAHGFAIHYGAIDPPKSANVFLVAPKSPGRLVRSEYQIGRGVPCLIGVHADPSGDTREVALAYASAIGGGRAAILETTFREETETDLFGEQAVLCGGTSALVQAGFETLVEAGYEPEMAYFECLHELKLIVDLMYERGLGGMRAGISNTAEYGDYTRGSRIVDDRTKAAMRQILTEIQDGTFAAQWMTEHAEGDVAFNAMRREQASHPIERVGNELRDMMPWLRKERSPSVPTDELKFRVC